jgi:hypothetical protein
MEGPTENFTPGGQLRPQGQSLPSKYVNISPELSSTEESHFESFINESIFNS